MMKQSTLEELFARYSGGGDIDALAEVFDRVAPELERLARRLTVDRNQAQDVVQATFLTALERPGTFESGRALRPWLLGILVHRASEERRQAEKRPEVDRLVQRESEPPIASLNKDEFRVLVERAIEELPQSLRQVLQGRLLEDKGAGELAEELAISAGTLRVRLHRGLERLRSVLPTSLATGFALAFIHSRGLAQVRSRVLQQASRASAGKGVVAGAGAVGIGAALMSKKLGLALGATLVALLAAVLYQSSLIPDETTKVLKGLVASLPDAKESSVGGQKQASLREAVALSQEAEYIPGHGRIVIEVKLPNGDPAPGLSVGILLVGGDPELPIVASTDEEGVAQLDMIHGSKVRSVNVPASANTAPSGKWVDKLIRDSKTLRIDLVLRAGWPLSGRVLDRQGQAVPGAELTGWRYKNAYRFATADAQGRFRLEHLASQFKVTASAPGMACYSGVRGTLSNTTVAEGLSIVLAPETQLTGVVWSPAGQALEGADVWIQESNSTGDMTRTPVANVWKFTPGTEPIQTDTRGRFTLAGLAREKHSLHVKKAPYLVSRDWLETGDQLHEIRLDAGLSLGGRVLNSKGEPAVGAQVRFWPFWGNIQTVLREVECDERGEFQLTGMNVPQEDRGGMVSMNDPPINHAIAIHHLGHALDVVQPVHPSRTGGDFVTIRLAPALAIAGRVVDPEGTPVGGVKVWIEGDREMDAGATFGRRSTWEYCNNMSEQETDSDGTFRFERMYAGAFTVHAIFPEDQNRTAEVQTRSGDESVELVLDADVHFGVFLTGQVLDASTREPVSEFVVFPSIDGHASGQSFKNAEGRFEVSGLPPGPIQVSVDAEGYARRPIALKHYTVGEHRLDFFLARQRELTVRIVDELGIAYKGGRVEALNLEGEPCWIGDSMSRSKSINLKEGTATLRGLPAEPMSLRIRVGPRDERGLQVVPIDLTLESNGVHEIVIERFPEVAMDGRLNFTLLAARTLDAERQLLEELDAWREDGSFKTLGPRLMDGSVSFFAPETTLVVKSAGRVVSTAKITRLASGDTQVETGRSSSSFEDSGSSYSSVSSSPIPSVHLDHLPVGVLTVEASSVGYVPVVWEFECSSTLKPKVPVFRVLRLQQ